MENTEKGVLFSDEIDISRKKQWNYWLIGVIIAEDFWVEGERKCQHP